MNEKITSRVKTQVSTLSDPTSVRAATVLSLCVALFHLIVAVQYYDHPVLFDEAYHLLAAQSWNSEGTLRILDGEYTRASLWTKMIALTTSLCGDDELCARALPLGASVAWIFVIVFVGSRWFSGISGTIAGALTAITPPVVVAAHTIRFYSFHALLITLAGLALFFACQGTRRPKQVSIGLLSAAVCLYVALKMQVTTLVAAGALAVALGLLFSPIIFRGYFALKMPHKIAIFTLAAVGLIVSGLAIDWAYYLSYWKSGPMWSSGLAENYLYYHHVFKGWFPFLWAAAPILIGLSIASRPALSVFLVTVFVLSFVVFSTAYAKDGRYIMYAVPFLYLPLAHGLVIASISIISGIPKINVIPSISVLGWRPGKFSLFAASGVAVAWMALMQPLVPATLRMLTSNSYVGVFGFYERFPDWTENSQWLTELVNESPYVITTTGVPLAYSAGSFDLELYYSLMLETDTRTEFGLDRRTGRRVISSAESLQKAITNNPSGVFVGKRIDLTSVLTIPLDTRELLLACTNEIEAPDPKLVVRVWTNSCEKD